MSPLDYPHRLRLERAKMLLEVSLHETHAIAQSCGYGSVASFRRLFRALAGMTPGQYRARFQLWAKRPRWKVEAIRDSGGGG
jgi:transcriptional regulator GlxA family with amidase domain